MDVSKPPTVGQHDAEEPTAVRGVVARLGRWRVSGPVLIGAVCALLIAFGAILPEPERMRYIAEHGFIENLTVVGYGALILALLAVAWDDRPFFTASAAVVATMAARELDLHKAFTSGSLLKLRTYTGDTPLTEKLIAGGVIAILAVFLLWYALRYGARLYRGIKIGDALAVSVATAVVFLVAAKAMDSFARVFLDITGLVVNTGTWLQLAEEVFELGAPLVLLWALLQYAVWRRAARSLSD